jgi:anti-sigma-K factor RskA
MNGHPTREEDFDLYALGALEGDENVLIESHVASCADCTRKLAEARGRVALLALSVPLAAPSPGLKVRLMKQVRDSAQAETLIAVPLTVPQESEQSGGFFGRWWVAVLAPAAVALAVASIFLWTENRRLDQQLAGLRTDMQQQREQLRQAHEIADLITARDTITVALSPQPGVPKGTGHVMYNAKMGMLMYDGELASAPADKAYQLWLVPAEGNPISAGVFHPVTGETTHFMMKLPEGVTPKAFAVTLEPAGGQPQPTGPKILVGAVS